MKKKIQHVLIWVMLLTLLVGCNYMPGNETEEFPESGTITESDKISETEDTAETEENSETEDATEPKPEFTFESMSKVMYANAKVNIRALPNTSGKVLGSLQVNDEILVTARCVETGWYQVKYNTHIAYVHYEYLAEEKLSVASLDTKNEPSLFVSCANTCG